MTKIAVVSCNARGLRERQKRRALFRHFHLKYPEHIVCLQETHSTLEVERQWENEWGFKVLYSHGSALSAGVAILLPRQFAGTFQRMICDDDGRIVGIQFTLDGETFAVVGIYAPAVDVQREKVNFLENLKDSLEDFMIDNMILCGDFNIYLGPLDAEVGKYKSNIASTYRS